MSRILFIVGDKRATTQLIDRKKIELDKRGIAAVALDLSPKEDENLSANSIVRELAQQNPSGEVTRIGFLAIQPPERSAQSRTFDWSLKRIINLLQSPDFINTLRNLIEPNIFVGSANVSSNLAGDAYEILASTAEEHKAINLDSSPNDFASELGQMERIVNQPRGSSKHGITPLVFDVKDSGSSLNWFLDSAFRLMPKNTQAQPSQAKSASPEANSASKAPKQNFTFGIRELVGMKNPAAQNSLAHLLRVEHSNETFRRIGGLQKFAKQTLADIKENDLSNPFEFGVHADLRTELACFDGFKLSVLVEDGESKALVLHAKYADLINANLNKDSAAAKNEDKSSFFRRYLRRILNKLTEQYSIPLGSNPTIIVDVIYPKTDEEDTLKLIKKLKAESSDDLLFLSTDADAKKLNKFRKLAQHQGSGLKLIDSNSR